MIGKTVSHYKILEKLGEGGMGVVYKAQDTKLKRTVALKFLPSELTRDGESRKRFIHEAQAASALQQNNVATIHEINETEDGQMFICMACYEGEILKDKIQRGPLKIDEAMDITVQVAQGLDKAHQKGIVHRDIKPGNLFLADDGVVKIIDFGLAKLGRQTKVTKKGTTLGTVAYMSPEQTQGEGVDKRTDIWSLGVVLYEMLTGQLPFKGDYEQAVIYSILNEEPEPITGLRTGIPVETANVVKKALSKNLDERYRNMGEMLADLKSLGKAPALSASMKRFPKTISKFHMLVFIITFVFTFFMIFIINCPKGKEFHIQRTVPLTTAPGLEQDPTWSPDGSRIAYASDESGNMDIWVRQIAAAQRVNLTKDYTGYDGKPAWSPDGEWIAFVSERNGGGIFVIPALGGIPNRVVSLSFAPSLSYGGAIPSLCWSPDGTELAYAVSGSIYIIPSGGGEAAVLTLPPNQLVVGYSEPAWSPNGKRIACTNVVAAGRATSQIWSVQRDGTDPVPVTEGEHFDYNPVWSSDGKQIFFISDRGGSRDVWWKSVDDRGNPTGQAHSLTAGAGVGAVAISKDGSKIIYTKVVETTNIWSVPIVADRTLTLDDALALTSENHYIDLISVSPDGKRIAFDSNRSGNQDIWIMRNDGHDLRQLTTNTAHDWMGSWSPDGNQIVFHSLRNGNRDLFVMPVAGGAVRSLTNHPADEIGANWSPDGESIAFFSNRSGHTNVWVMPSNGGDPRQLTFRTALDLVCWSPDSKQIVFSSDRTGYSELFLIPSAGGDPLQLTHGMWLSISPCYWSSDGRTIYCWAMGGQDNAGYNLWAVSVPDGAARPLIDFRGSLKEILMMSSDGQRIYFTLWECVGDIWMAELSRDEE